MQRAINDLKKCLYISIDDVASKEELYCIIKKMTSAEQNKVLKFRMFDDQKRALLSILLQRKVIKDSWKVGDSDYQIERTREGKPFVKLHGKTVGSWNFNVSHHGKYVAIATDSQFLVGVDIVDILTRTVSAKANCSEYIKMFSGQLSPSELKYILKQPNDDQRFTSFFIVWSLKESYIKAIGLGLGFDLAHISFEVHSDESLSKGFATASIKGVVRSDWSLEFQSLDERHIMSVARGPIVDALPSYAEVAQLKLSSPLDVVEKPVLLNKPATRVSVESLSGYRSRVNSAEDEME